jgi:signal transduction histidine kinase
MDLMARLAEHRVLGKAPVEEHAWLVAHGRPHTFEVGDIVTRGGELAIDLMVVFVGHIVIRADRGTGSKIFEWTSGDVGGSMPYSRGASPPHDAVAEEKSETLLVDSSHLPDMIRDCPVVTTLLVHVMLDRARTFTTAHLRDEKLIALGKVSAGIAHELNNPASAVVRGAASLNGALLEAEIAARRLAGAGLSEAQFEAIDRAREACGPSAGGAGLSAIERADREDAIADWLADNDASDEMAPILADTAATIEALDQLAGHITGPALDATIRWLAACCQVRSLSSEIETASTRIHHLVGAIKGFSFMDRAPVAEPVDIRRGISDTLTILATKARSKSVDISIQIPEGVPRVHAVGAELNQVWMNLIDNALDAAPAGGKVTVSATCDLGTVIVHVIDDGPGIPPEIRERIFDPFFTTKEVGAGSGLGLDIVRRLLKQHEAGISVESEPGRTDFQVRLPAAA